MAEDLPQKSPGIAIAPEAIPARSLTTVSLRAIVPVADCPNSMAIDWPVVLPARLIAPEELRAII